MNDASARIIYNSSISGSYFRLGLETGWSDFVPGQFVMLKVPGGEVLIRRPFSISRKIDNGVIELIYKIVGKGTDNLHRLGAGETVDILGPLGNGFSLPSSCKMLSIVAGGFGIAPFMGLLEKISKTRIKTSLYYGGKGMADILFLEDFAEMGISIHITTEDGSLGTKGLITDVLEQHVIPAKLALDCDRGAGIQNLVILACGPKGLLDSVVKFSRKNKIKAYVSCETYMACGIGVCLGCVVKTNDGYKRACADGPVFDVGELVR